ncbi:uncharacterized protein LAJ45_11182 [Morchella importuna]|uniref:uncharacterized protein n=1 Tax=Morchella importuna TaxID=1174673 RepID=UPI001E8D26BF|nr:uncharacterized protein LAJ45_11182 [Morchella importuna]KAH8144845.1 hypothetical protein LAJ45_11182 [Morchella importuna]
MATAGVQAPKVMRDMGSAKPSMICIYAPEKVGVHLQTLSNRVVNVEKEGKVSNTQMTVLQERVEQSRASSAASTKKWISRSTSWNGSSCFPWAYQLFAAEFHWPTSAGTTSMLVRTPRSPLLALLSQHTLPGSVFFYRTRPL